MINPTYYQKFIGALPGAWVTEYSDRIQTNWLGKFMASIERKFKCNFII